VCVKVFLINNFVAGEKPYLCKNCGRSFRNNYMLKVHMRLHTGEKNFKCEECGALFTERGALVCHTRTHTGVKPFACIFCDRKFAQNPALKRHLRIHTKVQPHTCSYQYRVLCDCQYIPCLQNCWILSCLTYTFASFLFNTQFQIVLPLLDCLCGVVVRVSGCRPRGPQFDSWRYQIF
jgi:uncharacterized Zn-finger protein